VLFTPLEAISSGPDGIAQASNTASNTLVDGIEWAYLHTRVQRSALRLYLLYLECRLLVEDEPIQVMQGPIASPTPAELARAEKYPKNGRRSEVWLLCPPAR
jgi:hypothetical protein